VTLAGLEPAGVGRRRLAARAWEGAFARPAAIYSAVAVYGLGFAAAVTLYYLGFHEPRLDLGDMVQAIWSTSHGHLLMFSSPTGQELSRLGAHADVFLVLLVPFWLVWPSPLAILIAQALAVSAGAIPVFWLARKHLASERAATHLALAYLLFPATQFNAFTPTSGFHSISFAVPFVLFAIWFLDNDRLLLFALFALLAASTKEEMPLAVGCLGLWFAFARGRRTTGLVIFACGAALSLFEFLVLIPHYAAPGFHPFAERYASAGGSTDSILHNALAHPLQLLEVILSVHKAVYVALLLVPLLGLALLEPLILVGAVPDLAINLLSDKGSSTLLGSSYTAGILPFLFAATVFGLARLRRDPRGVSLALLVAVLFIAAYSPLVLTAHTASDALRSNPHRAAVRHAIELVPADASVSATNAAGGYLSTRRSVSIFPNVDRAQWVVLDKSDKQTVPHLRSYAVRWLKAHPEWTPAFSAQGVYVLKRRG
jgi:uncharacterized membrane protein